MFAAAGFAVLSGCRQDMHNQPKFIPLRSSEFYSDRRSARYPVPGTVPQLDDKQVDQAQLDPGSYFLTGRHGNIYGNELPGDSTENRARILARGQERYNIYCTPCHSMVGDGNGMIVQRGYKRPPSFHVQRLKNAPLGWFYDVISNGFGGMPDYAAQVKPADRWAIAAYIRALQLSQGATDADVPQADHDKLNKPEDGIRVPDTSLQPPAPAPHPEGGVKQ
ncbi:MAG TPA: cytochrome c [Verrucomicrobiae bacterium]|nr:cytochrome c [Verrucomicrobiae bacterium]